MHLITGATGFIGKKLVSALQHKGDKIRIVGRNPQTNVDCEMVVCDFEKELIPQSALNSINTVFHVAGFAHDMRDADKIQNVYYKVNVDATVKLAKLAAHSGVKKFIFISSVKAGGERFIKRCMDESDQTDPKDIYGKTKREAELRLLDIGRKSNMHISIVRPSLVYGPNSKGNLASMLSGIESGWFPPLPEVSNKRSMIHVDDLVQAILLVANDCRANGEVFIATDGRPYSSREIYTFMCGTLEKKLPSWYVPKILFNIASLISPRIKYKINKLLGDECYSSAKLEALGFQAKKSLRDINETDF